MDPITQAVLRVGPKTVVDAAMAIYKAGAVAWQAHEERKRQAYQPQFSVESRDTSHDPFAAFNAIRSVGPLGARSTDVGALGREQAGDAVTPDLAPVPAEPPAEVATTEQRIEELLADVAAGDQFLARRQLLELFDELGPDDPRVRTARRRLPSLLF